MPIAPTRRAPKYNKVQVTTLKSRGPKRGVGAVPTGRKVTHRRFGGTKTRKVARPYSTNY